MMKTLTLLRHAKSGDDGFLGRDFDRRLNAKGRRAAMTMGQYLKREGLAFDAILASPAARVRETLEEVAAAFGTDLAPLFRTELYLAPAADLLEAVRSCPDTVERLLLVGHNPGLEDLTLALVPDRADDRVRGDVEEKYPTASVAEIALDIDRWALADEGQGRLIRFVRPRDLDPALGPEPIR